MRSKRRYDVVLLLAVLAILAIGIVMITSIGVPKSIHISAPGVPYANCSLQGVDCYLVLKNHLMRVGVGLVGMLITWAISYKFWKNLAPLVLFASIGLLLFVLIGGSNNGTFATSWINLSFLPFADSLQPSEIAKFGLILYLSYFFTEKLTRSQLEDFNEGFLKFLFISGLVIGLVVGQPDIGSAVVMGIIAVSVYFAAGAKWQHLGAGFLLACFLALLAVTQVDHIKERVVGFLQPDPECREEECWQPRQARISIGSGGFWGKGLTQGVQKSFWLPQASDDFIFAASAEELGFVRMSFIVVLYAIIAYRGFKIAVHAPSPFAMLIATGITTWITAQAFINILVNVSLFPITGITLPFMSYGGSSMMTTLAAVGVLLNISQHTTQNAYSFDRGGDGRSYRAQPRSHRRFARSY